jgi:hypothetical protein
METTRTAESECKKCNYKVDSHTGDGKPSEGDYSICGNCTSICVYDKDLNLIPLSPEEIVDLYMKEDLLYLNLIKNQRYIRYLKLEEERLKAEDNIRNIIGDKIKSAFIIDLNDKNK